MPENNLEIMRHSLAHILAQAVLELYPNAKLAIGPAIKNGFYYDFDLGIDDKTQKPRTFAPEDLPKIETIMRQIIKQDQQFEQVFLSAKEALSRVKKNPYKTELVKELIEQGEENISFYQNLYNGEVVFEDMCKGPHVQTTGQVGVFKLDKIAGAYWRGEEKNKMLQRIYGLAFGSQEELEHYLQMREEAEKRDHRRIGQEQKLFIIDEEVGAGLPIWLPKGALLRQIMEDFVIKEYLKNGYLLVKTPHIAREALFQTSGHLDFYKDDMYAPMNIEGEDYYIKPMNCPFHIKVYKNELRSYRDLPLRYAELGTVYRYERSGTLHGLTRVRGFTQDDGHIICTAEQLVDELTEVLRLTQHIYQVFGFKDFETVLSVRDPKNKHKYLGTDQQWEFAEKCLKQALIKMGWQYTEEIGEAVFYGPKIDIKVTDAIGRKWQLSTLQMDFNLPKRFEMTYVTKENKLEQPFMLHRALLGSLERFTGVLIEHYAGAFPVWLSPVQVKIIPIGKSHYSYADQVFSQFLQAGIRAELDATDETVSYKIRKAEHEKVPFMAVIGDQELKNKTLNIRERGVEKQTEMPIEEFLQKILSRIEKYQ